MNKIYLILLWFCIGSNFFIHCEARTSPKARAVGRKLKPARKLLGPTLDPLVGPQLAEAPFQFSLYEDTYGTGAPSSQPVDAPPFCVYPPFAPNPPSPPQTPIYYQPPPPSPPEFVPGPPDYGPSPPESPVLPNPPEYVPSPPAFLPGPPIIFPSPPAYLPGPPEYVPSPPEYVPNPPGYVPSPPEYVPGPPVYFPGPPGYFPGPPVFQPPVIYPPPAVPPPPYNPGKGLNMWCVAKPTVPDPIIQEAMNYACGSGADCDSIQPEGSCYQPDTLLSHASYAFNSYWQQTKATGGRCDFGGTATLITQDPSFDGCHFILF